MKSLTTHILLSICLGVTGCQFKKAGRDAHEGGRATELTIGEGDSAKKISTQNINSADLQKISDSIDSAQSAGALASAITELENIAINSDSMMDLTGSRQPLMSKSLQAYNIAIIKLAKMSPDSAELTQVMDRYEKLILNGCSTALRGCKHLSLLKTDQRSSEVILIIAQRLDKKLEAECKTDCSANLKRFYNLLGFAFDLGNALRKTDLEFLYIKRALEYGRLFQKEGKQNAQMNAFFEKHGHVFETIVTEYPADVNNPRFAEFVRTFKPWNYSRLNENPFPFGMKRLFSFAANNYVYSTDGKALSNELKAAIEDSQKDADKAGNSFRMIVKQLKDDSKSTRIFKNLGLDIANVEKPEFYNEYFFMIDRLYRGHLDIEEVGNFWSGSKKDTKALLQVTEFYLKVEIIRNIVATNKYMGSVFLQKGLPNDILFKEVVMRSEPMTKEWNMLFSRMGTLSIFVTQQLQKDKVNLVGLQDLQQLVNPLTLQKNTTLLSVSPNMLLLSYFLIEFNAAVKFNTWWGAELSVDPTTVMSLQLDGSIPRPWFAYGGASTVPDKAEIIYAFYYALNTGAFETYADSAEGKARVDRVSFYKKGLKKSMQKLLEDIDESQKTLSRQQTGSSAYNDAIVACKLEEISNKNYEIAAELKNLTSYTLYGNASAGHLGVLHEIYNGSAYLGAPAIYRNEFDSRFTQLRAMADILQQNVKSLSLSKEELTTITKELDAEIESIEGARKNFLKSMVAQHKLVTKCFNIFMYGERDRQSKLFQSEIEHLKKVYKELTDLRKLTGEAKTKAAEAAALRLGLDSSESLANDVYVFSKYSLLKRFEKISHTMLPKVIFDQPDESETISLKRSLEKVYLIDPITSEVSSAERFVSAGMTLLNSQGSNTLGWLKDSVSFLPWQNKINSMIEIYKMSFDANLQKDPEHTISAEEIIDEGIELAKYLNINDTEKAWLKIMNRRERIERETLKGYLFENSENDFKGILDTYYEKIANVKEALNRGTDYYKSTKKNMGRLIFPIPNDVHEMIDKRYKEMVSNVEESVTNFESALDKKTKGLDLNQLTLTYRYDEQNDYIYTTKLIDGGESVLVKERLRRETTSMLSYFHNRDTETFYKAKAETKK